MLKVRLVCKDWLNVFNSFPHFTLNNYLRLDWCDLAENEPPLSLLQNSSLQFNELRIGRFVQLKYSVGILDTLAQLGKSIRVLDLREACPITLIVFIENLHLFKKLNLLKVDGEKWCNFAESTAPNRKIMESIFRKCFTSIPSNDVQGIHEFFFGNTTFDMPDVDFFFKRYREHLFYTAVECLERLALDSNSIQEVDIEDDINQMVNEVREKIIVLNSFTNLTSRIDQSVKVLRFDLNDQSNYLVPPSSYRVFAP